MFTFNATFLNLFIARNCFSLFSTLISSGVSGASPSSLIQGWSAMDSKKNNNEKKISDIHST